MEGPAETTAYFIAGYTVIFGTLIVYLTSLVMRFRRLHQDKARLTDLQSDEEKASLQEESLGTLS
jgi:hypothetical protein